MQAGRISAGNARRLANAVADHDEPGVERELDAAVQYAQRIRAPRILFTSEWLLPALAPEGKLEWLSGLLHRVGAKSVNYLLFLRNPLDQCLSLYKHRAKGGTACEIAEWLNHGYRLPEELAGFRGQAEAADAEVQVRRYDRSPGALERMFFEEWLGIPVPSVDVRGAVNPSLTLSELALLRQMAETRPELVESVYYALAAVDPEHKVQGEAMLTHARAVAAQAVSRHAEEWAAWNRRLPEGEKLEIPEPPDEVPPAPTELALSEPQMRAVCELIAESAKLRFVAYLFWRSRLRPILARIKRMVWR